MDLFTLKDLMSLEKADMNYLRLTLINDQSDLEREIRTPKINRPGLALSGFFDQYDESAMQLFGHGERRYILMLEEKNQYENIEKIFSYPSTPCCIFTDGYTPSKRLLEIADKYHIPVLVTQFDSADFSRRVYTMLDEAFAKKVSIHGTLVEVYGLGVLILGESGIGKSETALALIERGHRLISDDIVCLKNIQETLLIGSGEVKEFQHNMEVRGLGIINIEHLFGSGAVKQKTVVQLVVRLEEWDNKKEYDRISSNNSEEIVGIKIPCITIPIRPGRNIPILIETAARNQRLKAMGHDSSKEFEDSVLSWLKNKSMEENDDSKHS